MRPAPTGRPGRGVRYDAGVGATSVNLSHSGPPETILEDEPAEMLQELSAADGSSDPVAAISGVCVRSPACLEAWADLGEALMERERPALAYAAFRTGYHRGLDRLRARGWRGSGWVRWRHRANRGFLRSLRGLGNVAAEIGETDEARRCRLFLKQLDPDWPPGDSMDPPAHDSQRPASASDHGK